MRKKVILSLVQYQINTDTEDWNEEILVNSFELINWIYNKLIK